VLIEFTIVKLNPVFVKVFKVWNFLKKMAGFSTIVDKVKVFFKSFEYFRSCESFNENPRLIYDRGI